MPDDRVLPSRCGPVPVPEECPGVNLIDHANGAVSKLASRFRWQNPRHPALQQLREREKLDDVVTGCTTDFDRVLALKGLIGTLFSCDRSARSRRKVLPHPAFALGLVE